MVVLNLSIYSYLYCCANGNSSVPLLSPGDAAGKNKEASNTGTGSFYALFDVLQQIGKGSDVTVAGVVTSQ